MALQQSNLEDVVKSMSQYSECFSEGWNSQVTEFKPFLRRKSVDQTDNFYFRLFHAGSGMKYVKEKHRKLYKQFEGLFVNVEVKLTSQKIHDCVYLIRGNQNYFSLQKLIQKEQRKVLNIPFILSLLQFFDDIICVNRKLNLNININASTILENDGAFKLADYNLLFHPNNLRSKDEYLEVQLITQMKYIIFDILELKNRETRHNFQETCSNLINHLKQRKNQCNQFFIEVIQNFFKNGTIMTEEIINFKSKIGTAINETTLFQSTLTASDISIPLLQRQQTSGSDDTNATIKPKINRQNIFQCIFISVIVILLAALGLTYFFLTRDIDCGNFHYKQNKQCFKCPDSCYSCIGAGEYNCTYCITSYWLVLKNINDKVGKCSVDCMGFKDSTTMHCLPQS